MSYIYMSYIGMSYIDQTIFLHSTLLCCASYLPTMLPNRLLQVLNYMYNKVSISEGIHVPLFC